MTGEGRPVRDALLGLMIVAPLAEARLFLASARPARRPGQEALDGMLSARRFDVEEPRDWHETVLRLEPPGPSAGPPGIASAHGNLDCRRGVMRLE